MKTQANLVRPSTLDVAIDKYLARYPTCILSFPRDVYAIGRYRKGGCSILVYKQDGKLVFDLGHIQNEGVSSELKGILRNLERYLWRTQHLSYDDHIILKYTKYWD